MLFSVFIGSYLHCLFTNDYFSNNCLDNIIKCEQLCTKEHVICTLFHKVTRSLRQYFSLHRKSQVLQDLQEILPTDYHSTLACV